MLGIIIAASTTTRGIIARNQFAASTSSASTMRLFIVTHRVIISIILRSSRNAGGITDSRIIRHRGIINIDIHRITFPSSAHRAILTRIIIARVSLLALARTSSASRSRAPSSGCHQIALSALIAIAIGVTSASAAGASAKSVARAISRGIGSYRRNARIISTSYRSSPRSSLIVT